MALKTPELSLGTGIAVAVLAGGAFTTHLPPVVDVRTVESGNRDVESSVKAAAWTAGAAVAAVSLIAQDATIFILGGATVVALTWMYHHANHVSPLTGKLHHGGMTTDDLMSAQNAGPHAGGPTSGGPGSPVNYSGGYDPVF